MGQIVDKKSTERSYEEMSIFMKEVNTQISWIFELGTQEGISVPLWIIASVQQRDRQHDRNSKIDPFCRPPVISAQCIIGAEK